MLVVMWFLFALIYLNISFTRFSLDFFLRCYIVLQIHVYLALYLDKMKDDTFLFFFRHLCIYTCTLNQLKNITTINQLILRVGLYLTLCKKQGHTVSRCILQRLCRFHYFPGVSCFFKRLLLAFYCYLSIDEQSGQFRIILNRWTEVEDTLLIIRKGTIFSGNMM